MWSLKTLQSPPLSPFPFWFCLWCSISAFPHFFQHCCSLRILREHWLWKVEVRFSFQQLACSQPIRLWNCLTTQLSIQTPAHSTDVHAQTHTCSHTSIPPCLTGRGNGFSPFGEPQTRGAAGPFQIAALLKSPSVYEYGDEDLGARERRKGGKNRGRERSEWKKRGSKREILCLWGAFPAYPVALGWIYALDLKCVCVC